MLAYLAFRAPSGVVNLDDLCCCAFRWKWGMLGGRPAIADCLAWRSGGPHVRFRMVAGSDAGTAPHRSNAHLPRRDAELTGFAARGAATSPPSTRPKAGARLKERWATRVSPSSLCKQFDPT